MQHTMRRASIFTLLSIVERIGDLGGSAFVGKIHKDSGFAKRKLEVLVRAGAVRVELRVGREMYVLTDTGWILYDLAKTASAIRSLAEEILDGGGIEGYLEVARRLRKVVETELRK